MRSNYGSFFHFNWKCIPKNSCVKCYDIAFEHMLHLFIYVIQDHYLSNPFQFMVYLTYSTLYKYSCLKERHVAHRELPLHSCTNLEALSGRMSWLQYAGAPVWTRVRHCQGNSSRHTSWRTRTVHSASSWRELRNSLCSPPWSVRSPAQMLPVCNREHQTYEFAEAEFHNVHDSRKIIF